MQGRRLKPDASGVIEFASRQPGDYFFHPENRGWMGLTPNGHLCNLRAHEVTEHEDGTITVAPSILVRGGTDGKVEIWHGHLKRGVWEPC